MLEGPTRWVTTYFHNYLKYNERSINLYSAVQV